MTSRSFSSFFAFLVGLVLFAAPAAAQFRGFQAASVEPTPLVELKPGESAEVALRIRIRRGYHINSDKPSEDYMYALRMVVL